MYNHQGMVGRELLHPLRIIFIFVCYSPVEFMNAGPNWLSEPDDPGTIPWVSDMVETCTSSLQGDTSDWSELEGEGGRGVLQLPQSLGKIAAAPSTC